MVNLSVAARNYVKLNDSREKVGLRLLNKASQ